MRALLRRQSAPLQAEYAFLLGRYIDSATLARANEIALRWGVHPHEVMIANGWLDAEDYYRALAQDCGAPFKAELPAADVAPAATATPRQSLATGLLKERDRARRFVFAPDRVRPNALREMLGRLAPHEFSLASPQAVRGALCRHFAPSFVLHAVEGLASRRPAYSARTRPARWQRLALIFGVLAMLCAVALAPLETVRAVTALLALLFVPLIGSRLLAAYGLLLASSGDGGAGTPWPRVPDHELPIYTLLVPLYREAHMLPQLVTRAIAARLSGGEARHQDRPRGERPRDDRRGAGAPASRQFRDRRRAGAASPHQAEGAQLRAAARPRRIYCDLRRRGPAGAGPAPPGAACLPCRARPISPRCRRGSISTTSPTTCSPASSPSNIVRCSTGCCLLSTASSCPFRSVGPLTISAPRR